MTDDTPEAGKRRRALAAALAVFGRYGYRRTTMEDIAAEAGMSRPALYLLFRNKKDIFRSAAADLCSAGIQGVDDVLRGGRPFAQQLVDALILRHAQPFRLIAGLAHGDELLSLNGSIAGDIMAAADHRAAALFAAAFERADANGDISLKRSNLPPDRLAALILAAASGLKAGAASPDAYEQSLRDMAALFLAAVAPLAGRGSAATTEFPKR